MVGVKWRMKASGVPAAEAGDEEGGGEELILRLGMPGYPGGGQRVEGGQEGKPLAIGQGGGPGGEGEGSEE